MAYSYKLFVSMFKEGLHNDAQCTMDISFQFSYTLIGIMMPLSMPLMTATCYNDSSQLFSARMESTGITIILAVRI